MAKVSVIVPVYNAEKFIQSTMEMLCQSTLRDIEIVAVNDGSKDNSLAVLEECAKKDDRIKVFDKPNGGIFDARNRGLKEALGEYVCFCDQDDIVEPQMYEKMYHKAKEYQCELAMCGTGRYVDGQKIPYWIFKDDIVLGEQVKIDCFLPVIFNKTDVYHAGKYTKISDAIWKCMILRKVIEDNQLLFRRYVNYEDDRLFLLDTLARVEKVALLSDVLYYWTINAASTSHAPRYLSGLYEKDIKLETATLEIMQHANCTVENLQLFKIINGAWRYARLVENEANHPTAKTGQKIDIIKKIYEEDMFEDKVKAERYLPKDMFARKFVCKFLCLKWTMVAFFFWKTYAGIRRRMQAKYFWSKMQKKMLRSN